jgi:hypothetical protein
MAKSFIIYYKRGTGTFVVTEPRPWARDNQDRFPNHNFQTTQPTTVEVESYLKDNFQFAEGHSDDNIRVIYNFDPSLEL